MSTTEERLQRIEAGLEEVKIATAEARGSVKSGVIFIGALNAIVLPLICWLFASTVSVREENVAQNVKLERLENVCDESKLSSSTVRLPEMVARKQEKKLKENTKPAGSEQSATTISWNQTDE